MVDERLLMEVKDEEVTKEQKEALYKRVEELKCYNAALLAENGMFERFIGRKPPRDLVSQVGGEVLWAAEGSQLESAGHGRRRRSRSYIPDRLLQLTLEQKLYVARTEVKETREDHQRLKQRYERIQDNYKASLKEAELRLTEIRKARKEFERRLLKSTKDNRLQMKEPEKVLQYIIDKLKFNQLEKFNLKNQALKVQEKKFQQQLQQKKEMGKHDYEEIFQEYNEQTVDRNLDELQANSLKIQRILALHKEKLQNISWESTELSNDITNRKQMLMKIEEEIQHAEEDHLKAEALNQHLCHQIANFQAPDIIDYIRVKEKHKKLQQSIHTWERKVTIARMALNTHTKAWHTQRATFTSVNSTAVGVRSRENQIPVKLPNIAEHTEKQRTGKFTAFIREYVNVS